MQRSEEAAAQFKKWLKALSDHSRNLLGAKAALAAAETTAKVTPLHACLSMLEALPHEQTESVPDVLCLHDPQGLSWY